MKNDDFRWGAATSAYQIEGGAYADGKGLSVWDVFARQKGKISDGHNGDVGCEHYSLYADDVKLMQQIGINSYRFSVSWPRIFPDGYGKINLKGLDFYDRLTDELLKADIEPFVTLYHWDLPYNLFCRGGFLNDDIVNWFADYAAAVTKKLGDRCKKYVTLNEPQCVINLGYEKGEHAPGLRMPYAQALPMQKNVLLCHASAVDAIRANCANARVGVASCGDTYFPETGDASELEEARRLTFLNDTSFKCSWLLDPIANGKFCYGGNAEYDEYFGAREHLLKDIKNRVDFIGYNIYTSKPVKAVNGSFKADEYYAGYPTSSMGWPVNERSIYYMLKFVGERYNMPIEITENGYADNDCICLDGKVHDNFRIDYLDRHLNAALKAKRDGVNLTGYYVWSLLDNFEWAAGFSKRFGLVYVDYQTLKRTLKDSAYFYSDFIKTHRDV